LLTEENGFLYTSPDGRAGFSLIGFSRSSQDIAFRVSEIKQAYDEGHEIGSHAVGHFNGVYWNEESWHKEFYSFRLASWR
jgi:hypothetical protein